MGEFMRIKDLRENHDVRQSEIAAFLHISQNTYSQYESEKRQIPIALLILLRVITTSLWIIFSVWLTPKSHIRKNKAPLQNSVNALLLCKMILYKRKSTGNPCFSISTHWKPNKAGEQKRNSSMNRICLGMGTNPLQIGSSSPRSISIDQLHALLRFHLRPIKLVVYKWPYQLEVGGISHLEVCFTLRCLQRLSHPHAATQLCPWQDNWCTGGASDPVLSY